MAADDDIIELSIMLDDMQSIGMLDIIELSIMLDDIIELSIEDIGGHAIDDDIIELSIIDELESCAKLGIAAAAMTPAVSRPTTIAMLFFISGSQ